MTRLSVNINKIATLRNARGGNVPDVVQVAIDCQRFGAQGITVHPRPDERHIRKQDVFNLKPVICTEFNIEGYPTPEFLKLVTMVKADQVTLVPDEPGQITSDHGWNCIKHLNFLKDTIHFLREQGIRISLFVDPDNEAVEAAFLTGTDRIELYTEPYATMFPLDREKAVNPYVEAAGTATKLGLGLNAGHDLDLFNLPYLVQQIPDIKEVSIGHALISDALYLGLEETIKRYLACLKTVDK
jgi:pyridoxine 5-phosphate synthase